MSRHRKDGSVHRVNAGLLDVSTTATEIGQTESAARHMIERGQLPALKLGGRLYVRRTSLEKFLERKEREFMKARARGPEEAA